MEYFIIYFIFIANYDVKNIFDKGKLPKRHSNYTVPNPERIKIWVAGCETSGRRNSTLWGLKHGFADPDPNRVGG
ncbi:MAG: hypothetical protein LBC48_02080, partial [Dysgonamonadaceae bacterium]|nr:hypothetical protein [Dysgonamonadaceae bacterium]